MASETLQSILRYPHFPDQQLLAQCVDEVWHYILRHCSILLLERLFVALPAVFDPWSWSSLRGHVVPHPSIKLSNGYQAIAKDE
eukprot:5632640-Amphidinium_carterae.1